MLDDDQAPVPIREAIITLGKYKGGAKVRPGLIVGYKEEGEGWVMKVGSEGKPQYN